jgi:hypothetical protein
MKRLLTLLALSSLVACIDDSADDDDAKASLEQDGVGFFIDSPVQGLTYTSSSHSGTTDALGRFDYESGESIIFSIGDINLPAVTASKAIHVSDLYSGGLSDTATINLARLLLTIDSDNDSDNGIQLSSSITSSVENSALSNLNFSDSATVFASAVLSYAGNLVSVQDATDHITETKKEAEGLLAGCGNECVPRVAFMDTVENVFPRHAQQSVPVDSDISITFSADFQLDLNDMNVEMFAVGTGTYANCRIDWPGFRCDDLGVGSYDIHTDLITDFTPTITNKTIDFAIRDLMAGRTYIVHIYHDGEAGDHDDYKTWWLFYTD